MLACVSTQFLMMLKSPAMEPHDLSSLRCMFTGGEAVPVRARGALRGRHRRTRAAVLRFERDRGAEPHDDARRPRPPAADCGTSHRRHARPPARRRRVDITTPETPGHPVCKGPATCLGYLDDDRANEELFTADGWMRIGDLCTVDADGYLRVVGRTSDIIIRGGQEHQCAGGRSRGRGASCGGGRRGGGDARRGVRRAGLPVRGARARRRLVARRRSSGSSATKGVSPEWFPERLEVLDALPRASGGKVAKGELRADIRRRLDAAR